MMQVARVPIREGDRGRPDKGRVTCHACPRKKQNPAEAGFCAMHTATAYYW